MPPKDDKIWISKEEYQRLQKAAQPAAPAVAATVATIPDNQKGTPLSTVQIVLGCALALALLLSLTVPFFGFVLIPALLFFVIFAVLNLRDFMQKKKEITVPTSNPAVKLLVPAPAKPRKRIYKILLIGLLCIILAPVLFYGSFIVLVIIMFSGMSASGQSS